MSGHSKWSTIKHKKAKEDAKRGKIFTKLIREITVAAREGGGDIAGNAKLRLIVDKSKACNMPQDNIVRAIKKGTGELQGVNYESIMYEGYGPSGVAVIVETLTDNKKRTVADVRHIFSKLGGHMAENGSVSWMFEHKGVIRIEAAGKSEDDILEALLDYDIEDVSLSDGIAIVSCEIKHLEDVKHGIEKVGFKIEDAVLEWVAKDLVELENSEKEEKVFNFLGAIEDIDDVQNVYTNLG